MSYAKKRIEGVSVREMRDLMMISDPKMWTTNILPLKRPNDSKSPPWDLGFLRCEEAFGDLRTVLIVYMTNIYTIRGTTDWTNIPQKQYANARMILRDGWMVD